MRSGTACLSGAACLHLQLEKGACSPVPHGAKCGFLITWWKLWFCHPHPDLGPLRSQERCRTYV